VVVSTGMLATSYQESLFPLTSSRETSDSGKIGFEVQKHWTYSWIAPSSQTHDSIKLLGFSLTCEGTLIGSNVSKTRAQKSGCCCRLIFVLIIFIVFKANENQGYDGTGYSLLWILFILYSSVSAFLLWLHELEVCSAVFA